MAVKNYELQLFNEQVQTVVVYMEPWCEEIEMPASAHWVVESSEDDCSVAIHDFGIAIHTSPTARAIIRDKKNGEVIWKCFRVR